MVETLETQLYIIVRIIPRLLTNSRRSELRKRQDGRFRDNSPIKASIMKACIVFRMYRTGPNVVWTLRM